MTQPTSPDWPRIAAAVWRRHRQGLRPIRRLDPIQWHQLTGIERQQQALARNTERFLAGQPSNNALLWGARGTGKSSLIKALLNRYRDQGLRMVEVDKDDLVFLPEIVDDLSEQPFRFVIFCDDLSRPASPATRHSRACWKGRWSCRRRTCGSMPPPTAVT